MLDTLKYLYDDEEVEAWEVILYCTHIKPLEELEERLELLKGIKWLNEGDDYEEAKVDEVTLAYIQNAIDVTEANINVIKANRKLSDVLGGDETLTEEDIAEIKKTVKKVQSNMNGIGFKHLMKKYKL